MFRSRDCYSTPDEIYRAAKARGMDVVTITDHDCVDGCLEFLSRHPDAPDFLMGEEVECRLPPHGVRLHLGVFGLTERMHAEVQALRGDVREAAAFLRAGGAALVLHHPFHFFRGEIPAQAYLDALLPLVDAVEVRNGTMLPAHNDVASAVAAAWRRRRAGRPWGRRAAATRTSSGTWATRGRRRTSGRPAKTPDRRGLPRRRSSVPYGPGDRRPPASRAPPDGSHSRSTASSSTTGEACLACVAAA